MCVYCEWNEISYIGQSYNTSFPLVCSVISLLLQLWAGGIIDHSKYPRIKFDPRVNPNMADLKLEPVSLNYITSPLWFLAFGWGSSCLAFIYEIFKGHRKAEGDNKAPCLIPDWKCFWKLYSLILIVSYIVLTMKWLKVGKTKKIEMVESFEYNCFSLN